MKNLQLLLLIVMISGCSSITSRVREDSQLGKPYAGLEHAFDNAGECNAAAFLTFPPLPLLLLPISAVDVVSSLVLDTVILPVDLFVDNKEGGINSLCHIDMSH